MSLVFIDYAKKNSLCRIIQEHELMSRHTSFAIGGPADVLAVPDGERGLAGCLDFLRREGVTYYVMGNGSNLVVSDLGLRGVVLKLRGGLDDIVHLGGGLLRVHGGALLAKAAVQAQRLGLTGMEFAHGIPGTLGGAVVMNAGAYGGEMKDIVLRTSYIVRDGAARVTEGAAHAFGYRTSAFGEGDVILWSELRLAPADPAGIAARMVELARRRREKQPLDKPSAGSAFKRPEGQFAGKLIEDSGLRGYRVGGAQVSEKHCGFIINAGGATCADVRTLVRHIQETVMARFGVMLECEIRFVGESD